MQLYIVFELWFTNIKQDTHGPINIHQVNVVVQKLFSTLSSALYNIISIQLQMLPCMILL